MADFSAKGYPPPSFEKIEFDKVVNKMTQELRNSEYNHSTAKEMIVSGIRGWKVRVQRRVQKGQEYYRPAHSTTKVREYKKLMARESWYKEPSSEPTSEPKVENCPPRGSPSPGEKKQRRNGPPLPQNVQK